MLLIVGIILLLLALVLTGLGKVSFFAGIGVVVWGVKWSWILAPLGFFLIVFSKFRDLIKSGLITLVFIIALKLIF